VNATRAAVDAVFRDPHVATSALWFRGGAGTGLPLRVIRKADDRELSFNDMRLVADSCLIDARIADIETPAEGDVFEIEGRRFVVQGAPTRDARQLVWSMEARPE